MLFKDARVCAAGYVNAQELESLIRDVNFERNPENLVVIHISNLELWLRDLERRRKTVTLTAPIHLSPRLAADSRARVAQAYP